MQSKVQWNKNVLEPIFRELYTIEMEKSKRKDFVPVLFSVEDSQKDTESVLGIGGEGLMEEWGQSGNQVHYQDIEELWEKQFKMKKYSLGREIDRDLVDDLKLTQIKDKIKGLATAVHMTRQYQAVETFNNAFLTTTATDFRGRVINASGPDGVALCADNHPLSPTNAVDLQDNKGTSPLSIDAWDETAVAMQAWTDDTGNIMGAYPGAIVVHPFNARKAFQIAGIPGKEVPKYEPGSANYDINIYSGEVDVIVIPFLKNKFNWFAIDTARRDRFHKWFERRKPDYGSITDFDTEVAKFKVVGRWRQGFAGWSWIYGHEATE